MAAQPPPRPRNLCGVYLNQAVDALGDAGNPDYLYPGFARKSAPTDRLVLGFLYSEARKRQGDALRTAILFSALAAEAYVNEFLAHHLSGKDFDGVEKLSTLDKYVLGTRIITGKPLFDRDTEPAQTLRTLFGIRNRLVHPKPGYGPARRDDAPEAYDGTFTPEAAARSILHVAGAAVILLAHARPTELDFPAHFIWVGKTAIWDHADRVKGRLPAPDMATPPRLSELVTKAVGSKTKSEGHDDGEVAPAGSGGSNSGNNPSESPGT